MLVAGGADLGVGPRLEQGSTAPLGPCRSPGGGLVLARGCRGEQTGRVSQRPQPRATSRDGRTSPCLPAAPSRPPRLIDALQVEKVQVCARRAGWRPARQEVVEMRRLAVVLVLLLAGMAWPATSGLARRSTTTHAAGG